VPRDVSMEGQAELAQQAFKSMMETVNDWEIKSTMAVWLV
jgi:hypothetical protein